MYTLIRLQESTHPAVIKLPVLVLQPCTPGHSPGSRLCLSCVLDLAHTQLCLSFASPILTKPNAICSCVCFKSPARNKEKSKYLCWAVTLSIQAINDRLQQSLFVLCGISTVLAPASQPHQDETPTINSWVLTWGKMTECDWNMAFKKNPTKAPNKNPQTNQPQKNLRKIIRASLCQVRSAWSLCAVSCWTAFSLWTLELCWWFLSQCLGHKLSVCMQIFQSCLPLRSSKLKAMWSPEFPWDRTSFWVSWPRGWCCLLTN